MKSGRLAAMGLSSRVSAPPNSFLGERAFTPSEAREAKNWPRQMRYGRARRARPSARALPGARLPGALTVTECQWGGWEECPALCIMPSAEALTRHDYKRSA